MAYAKHVDDARSVVARCAIITLSDTRTPDTDTSGQTIRRLLEASGHTVSMQTLIKDEAHELATILDDVLGRADCDTVLTTGGTGISRRDATIGVIESAINQPLPGFGELFRMLSWEQIGSGAMLSRALAGVAFGRNPKSPTVPDRKLIFAMPGSTRAVELAMTKLVLPELGHLLSELRK